MEQLKYSVKYFDGNFSPDSNWEKPEWSNVEPLTIENTILNVPPFLPTTEVKVMYNEEYLYVIFRAKDKYVRSTQSEINSPVSKDSCVEFFFTPTQSKTAGYFNLEINAGGTPLIRFQKGANIDRVMMDIEDIKSIEIAHSLPNTVEPEICEETTWTLEYRIPLKMLNKYFKITQPAKGVIWRANFYKIAGETSNPHYIAWNKIEHPEPHFHLPEYFGEIKFI